MVVLGSIDPLFFPYTSKVSPQNAGTQRNKQPPGFATVSNQKTITIELVGSEDRILLWNQISNKLELVEDLTIICACATITLEDSRLKNKDVDKILRKWKTGGFPNLERLKIHGRNITNNGTTILEMDWMELNVMVIQTDDGSKNATIKTNVRSIEIVNQAEVKMLIFCGHEVKTGVKPGLLSDTILRSSTNPKLLDI
ncbi:hypothetical protein GCK72_003157 [Caenorhabditis remanei]|uniref:Sdz-33 F-box domain-containing protein n=1 Tax=Caenorhabditis remanei TaxID=31234 RepID=A0A6A5HVV0_CAERE|nr:hypothetical protein GCK72_003157 [Caenorhabditis remanei]KAF1771331.1 hypothetical protein GCK72_003157 [Caenorhabditis remanei]